MGLRRKTVAVGLAAMALGAAIGAWVFLRVSPVPPALPKQVLWPTVVTTLAGAGSPGLLEGRGVAASFADPFGVAVDAGGDTWLADAGDNNVIWRIDAQGAAAIVAGSGEGFADGSGRAAQFNTPSGIAFDTRGNLVVADTGNNAIRRVTPAGMVTTIAGGGEPGNADGPARDARFNGPIGVAVARDGTIVVADGYNDRIRRIGTDGEVRTVAGGGRVGAVIANGSTAGYQDGPAVDARFDTPSGVAVDREGDIYVADTGNDAIRRIGTDGQVTTVTKSIYRPVGIAIGPFDSLAQGRQAGQARLADAQPTDVRRPAAEVSEPDRQAAKDEQIFVTDGAGRVVLLSPAGEERLMADGSAPPRLRNPTGIAVAPDGTLRVADSDNYVVRSLIRPGDRRVGDIDLTPLPWLNATTLGGAPFPWPLDPQRGWHEVAATLGEARGSPGGDGRERLHSGIDVRGPVGALVRCVRDEKIERPVAANGFGTANESLRIGVVSYVHVRVGRTARGRPLDQARFEIVSDDLGRPARVRVRRGTRFRVGDAIGSVNPFAHVHLAVGPYGAEINPLGLPLPAFRDAVAPTIEPHGIELFSEDGRPLAAASRPVARARRSFAPAGPVPVSGRVRIVVEAYDRVDGNRPSRKLGVYGLGYQVLRDDGSAVPGFERPRMTIEFDRLPPDAQAPQMIYAEGSGITVYGSKRTRFRYIVTDELHAGQASRGTWDTSTLAPGTYRLRVFAIDRSGNMATRDLSVVVVPGPRPQ